MTSNIIKISVQNKKENIISEFYAEKITENSFRMIDNDLSDCRLTLGTEFEANINVNGNYEIVKILNESKFVTRRFFLSSIYKESEYKFLGEELLKHGGFWQIDFGGIATINIPEKFEYDVDQIMKELDLNLTEITS